MSEISYSGSWWQGDALNDLPQSFVWTDQALGLQCLTVLIRSRHLAEATERLGAQADALRLFAQATGHELGQGQGVGPLVRRIFDEVFCGLETDSLVAMHASMSEAESAA